MLSTVTFRGRVEFRSSFAPWRQIRHVLFDFDGTLSLIREGWPDVMLPLFLGLLPPLPGETLEKRRQLLWDDMMHLNGKQTIYQMIQFAERVKERGGQARDPFWYKQEYLSLLDQKIRHRIEGLRQGLFRPDDFLVYGSRKLLRLLQQRGLRLFLASGTDEPSVRQEAELLDLTPFFGSDIYGARDDYRNFSKKIVIERILSENRMRGENLLAFGDGFVEIQNTKEVGGLAVGVASDEANNGSGEMDPWKRERLAGVGADVIIADYRDAEALLECLMGTSQNEKPKNVAP